jgi:hypothetical protein
MSETVIITEEKSVVLSEKETVTVIVSETQGIPGVSDTPEITNMITDPLAYYILAKN